MSKKQPKYIQFEDTSKDVLKQNINEQTRGIARSFLRDSYLRALGLPIPKTEMDEDLAAIPDSVHIITKSAESGLFKEYSKEPKNYIRHLAKLILFLNPDNYAGQFAKLFRAKALQSVYTPERLAHLDITDILPEVFLNPKATPANKLDIYQGVDRVINDEHQRLVDSFNAILNPTARRPTRPTAFGAMFDNTDKLIAKNNVPVRKLCDNPYWDMKEVNMIICKEDNKFFCLDIMQLLTQLAEKDTATNYFTNKALDADIIDNLRNRYASEIAELKGGGSVDIGTRTNDEFVDLAKTVTDLQHFFDVYTKPSVKDALITGLGAFGSFEAVEDTTVGGEKGLLSTIPSLVLEQFEAQATEQDEPAEAVYTGLEEWLTTNINKIEALIADDKIKQPDETPAILEEEVPKPVKPAKSPPPAVKVFEAETKLIADKILVEGTVTYHVYHDYIQRLESARSTILELLKKTHGLEARSELNARLGEASSQMRTIHQRTRNLAGIIKLLTDTMEINNERLAKIKHALGMNMIYPNDIGPAQAEKQALEDYVTKLQQEIAYLTQLRENFVAEQKNLGNLK